MSTDSPIIFIQGPTGTGKSQLSMMLAVDHNAEIINCDSVQAYKHINIGSAKPTVEEMQESPHHLFDVVDFPEELTAGKYRRLAVEKIKQLSTSGKPIIVIGGSGFYFQALEKGMLEVEDISPEIEAQINDLEASKAPNELHDYLKTLDPDAAKKIETADNYRILRALSLNLQHKKTVAQLQEERTPGLTNPILKIGLWLDRQQLEPLIEERTNKMFASGLISEVEGLLSLGYAAWWPLSSVGYKEVVEHLAGKMTLDECKLEIIKNTLRLAKKQRTWFKRDKDIQWFNPIEQSEVSWQDIRNQVNQWLRTRGGE